MKILFDPRLDEFAEGPTILTEKNPLVSWPAQFQNPCCSAECQLLQIFKILMKNEDASPAQDI